VTSSGKRKAVTKIWMKLLLKTWTDPGLSSICHLACLAEPFPGMGYMSEVFYRCAGSAWFVAGSCLWGDVILKKGQ